jgi:hypothetical protein
MIYGPKDPPLKFQLSIQTKSAPIKIRAGKAVNYAVFPLSPRFDWVRIEG